jgi:hypothetical protein
VGLLLEHFFKKYRTGQKRIALQLFVFSFSLGETYLNTVNLYPVKKHLYFMSYPFQITSLNQYHKDYKRSVDEPEAFWGAVAENFQWRKNGIRCWNGILPNQKSNGLKVVS